MIFVECEESGLGSSLLPGLGLPTMLTLRRTGLSAESTPSASASV
jgi:hypothetical protein